MPYRTALREVALQYQLIITIQNKKAIFILNALSSFLLTLNTNIMAQQRPYKGENDPQIFTEVRTFLQALNSGDGTPMELLSPQDARQILILNQLPIMNFLKADSLQKI